MQRDVNVLPSSMAPHIPLGHSSRLSFFFSSSACNIFGLSQAATWRLDQSVRDTTAQRQIEAIHKLSSWSDPHAPSEKLIRCIIGGPIQLPLLLHIFPKNSISHRSLPSHPHPKKPPL